MKKVISFLLVLLFALITFCGCVKNDTPPNTNVNDDLEEKPDKSYLGEDFDKVDNNNIEKVITQANFEIDRNVQEGTDIIPNTVFSDKMMLQRNAVTCIYGRMATDGPIAAEINGKTFYGTSENNEFKIYMEPMEYGGPYVLTLYCTTSKYVIENVLIGEVFLMSGQSNMEWKISNMLNMGDQGLHEEGGMYRPDLEKDPDTYYQFYDENGAMKDTFERLEALKQQTQKSIVRTDHIRFCDTPIRNFDSDLYTETTDEREDANSLWVTANENDFDFSIGYTSAFAYYFALYLWQETGIPVGYVHSSVGGTYVSAWTPNEEYAENRSVFNYTHTEAFRRPNVLYNLYIAPYKDFKFKSVIWYQGEGQPSNYAQSMKVMIESWRSRFNDPNLAFVIVGLPRYGAGDSYYPGMTAQQYQNAEVDTPVMSSNYFPCREQQKLIPTLVSNVAVSVNIDTGDYDETHPSEKQKPAIHTACKFMEVFYKRNDKILSGPVVELIEKDVDGSVTITFSNVGDGLDLRNEGRNFEVAESKNKYTYNVTVELLNEEQIKLSSEDVGEINYIRYGYLNYPRISRIDMSLYVSVYNLAGFPLDQFVWEDTQE